MLQRNEAHPSHLTVRLIGDMAEDECARRNALTCNRKPTTLSAGHEGTVIETLENGAAYLVEFGHRSSTSCDWLGVLYEREVELGAKQEVAA